MPRPGRFTLGRDPVPTVLETGWALGLVWTGADRSARYESQYRLHDLSPPTHKYRDYLYKKL
jgi:hypothetical protein